MRAHGRRPTAILTTLVVLLHSSPCEAFAPPSRSLAIMPALARQHSLVTMHWLFRKRQQEKENDLGDLSQPTPSDQPKLQRQRQPVRKGRHPPMNDSEEGSDAQGESKRNARRSFLSVTKTAATAATASLLPRTADAVSSPSTSTVSLSKQYNLSSDQLKRIVLSDLVDKSFLVTADITRSIYDESATFTDEIDAYTMDKWITGTKSLFVASGSRVSLVGDVDVSPTQVSFRFDEDLMFNIPFKPVVSLTGKVVLSRDEESGLITSYREYWDQSVNDVLKTAKFGKKV